MEDLLQDQEAAAVGSQGTTGQQKAEDDKRQDVIAVDIAPTKTVEPSLPHVEPTAIVVPMSSIVAPALPVETRRPKPFSADIVTPSPALVTVLPQTPVPVSPSSSVSVPSVVAPSSPSTRASHTSPAPTATTSQQKQSPPPPPPKADTYIAPPLNTQDSVFKTILKRLTRLEENLTLSIGYIEDQGSRVRELFIAMEAQQREKLEGFIEDVDERLREDFEGVVSGGWCEMMMLSGFDLPTRTFHFTQRLRYASLWDDILLELRIFQETVALNMHTLHGAVDRMTYEVSLLQRWAVVQLFLMFALVVFGANLNGYARVGAWVKHALCGSL